jgi:hypothetical protein
MQRAQPLKRDKDQGEKQEPRALPRHAEEERKNVLQVQEGRHFTPIASVHYWEADNRIGSSQ